MTVNKLKQLCEKIIAAGNGRASVCIHKPTFTHNLEGDGCVILDVSGINVESIVQLDGDGGTKTNADGSEAMRRCAVLYGSSGWVHNGHILTEITDANPA